MRLDYFDDLRSMLGAAKGANRVPGGGGRIELVGWLAAIRPRLPRLVQRIWPRDFASALLLAAFVWTTYLGAGASYAALAAYSTYGTLLVLSVPIAVLGVAGIWYGARLWTVVPACVIWLALLLGGLSNRSLNPLVTASFAAALGVAALVGYQSIATSRQLTKRYKAGVNQLGWDLYSLSTAPPATDEFVDVVRVCRDLRVGELERHFDQVTSASIQGQMQHAFRMSGSSSSIHNIPLLLGRDSQTFSSMGGSGLSSVELAQSGYSRDDLTSDAFVAVLEQALPDGSIDTIRAVVPSERQARSYVAQLVSAWGHQLTPNSEPELMVRRYSGAISEGVTSESSYVGDRLAAILRMPPSHRPTVTVIGEPLGPHAVLAGALRFGSNGPLYQLFPVALTHALVALMAGRPLPRPPSASPPTAREQAAENQGVASPPATETVGSNGQLAHLEIRTIGDLRLVDGAEDITSALLDRRVLAFLWLYLLSRRIRNPNDSITRASLADELSPGLDSSTQRSRLRGRLSELRNQLPPALGKRLVVSGERISLDLTDCEIDIQRLLAGGRTYGKTNGVLSVDQLAELESLLARANGSFLPDWDDLEQHVNSGRGGAGEVVSDLRRQVELARTAVLRALGEGYLAHAKPEAAVSSLERALEFSPEDESVARSLIAACLQSGRLARAEALRKEFAQV